MGEFDRVPVIIPSYNPDEKLAETVAGMLGAGFTDIIIIDDGSREDTKRFFPEEGGGVTVLRHDVNRGKGAGLKTAFRYVLEHRPDAVGCVTADGDGQHRPEDVAACVREMIAHPGEIVIGARDFSLPGIPARSRKGNRITCRVFRLIFGMKLSDTQTGLRAFPRSSLPAMLTARGDRYEFETNMLIIMKRQAIPYREVMIQTVYIDDNATSHFRPVRDSLRIYGMIVAFALSSVVSMLLDLTLFTVFNHLFFEWGAGYPAGEIPWWALYSYPLAVAAARVISAAVNYTLNRRVVFADGDRSSVVRYFILAACQLAVSAAIGQALVVLIPHSAKWVETVIKLAVDLFLFFFSFRVQNAWVFRKKDGAAADNAKKQ